MVKPYYEDDSATLYHGDSNDLLEDMPSVDLIVADPPYSIGLQSNSKTQGWGDLMNGSIYFGSILDHFKRLTANRQGAAWLFCAWRSFPVISKASSAKWKIESLLVWDKMSIGPGGSSGLRPSYELVALFAHDNFRIANRSLPDIFSISNNGGHKPTGHPAEKPLPLMAKIIEESGGGLVLDPFSGSGTTLLAAKQLGHKAIGIEIEERYCEKSLRLLRPTTTSTAMLSIFLGSYAIRCKRRNWRGCAA